MVSIFFPKTLAIPNQMTKLIFVGYRPILNVVEL